MVSNEELSLNKEWFLAGGAPIELKFNPLAQDSLLPLPQLALTTEKEHVVGDMEVLARESCSERTGRENECEQAQKEKSRNVH